MAGAALPCVRAGGGVASYIRARRLKRSLADLLNPRMAGRPIYDIAHAWNFTSESDYSRAFRRRFGMSPREARQASRFPPDDGEAAHERWLAELGR
ncbi:helix-turn-helix domain-containing protein [Albimonas sp. CAU 1670]|nr:helix-turn-helix domain-containing protein [Albimonas sp. CAU 1670]MDF2231256.1 helix-turn-helix domain-containing protein [Albimonas sp. CAU 1670]